MRLTFMDKRNKNSLTKDQALIAASIAILLFSAMIGWNAYSWLALVAVVLVLMAWYFKR